MNPQLMTAVANSHYEDLRRTADARRLAASAPTSPSRSARMIKRLGFTIAAHRPAPTAAGVTDVAAQH